MGYHYDPILCMNVPDSTSKAKDASWKAWTLYIDGKWVKSFSSSMTPIKEAQKFMKENYPGKVGKLVRNTGSSSGYSISGSEYKDAAPAVVRDADIKLVQTIASKNGYAVHVVESDYGKRVVLTFKGESYKNPHMWLGEATEGNKRKAIEMMNEFAEKAGSKNHDSLDKALRTCDKFTVWESDEYDDIYVSYEGGTYVLYVENRPQADGSQQKMIQLGKQEERMRG